MPPPHLFSTLSREMTKAEKRLWIAAAVIQTTIYLSLSLGDNVVRYLRNNNYLRAFVAVILLLSLVAMAVALKRARPPIQVYGVVLMMLAVYAVVLFYIPRPEEKLHIVQYGAVTGLIFEALRQRFGPGRNLVSVFAVALVLGCALGTLDEGIQYLLPDRVGEFSDALLNWEAAFLAAFSLLQVRWVTDRRQRDQTDETV